MWTHSSSSQISCISQCIGLSGAGIAAAFDPTRGKWRSGFTIERALGDKECDAQGSISRKARTHGIAGMATSYRVSGTSSYSRKSIDHVSSLLTDGDQGIQEQSLSLLRNLCTDEESIELILGGLGAKFVLDLIVERVKSLEEDIIHQVSRLWLYS